MQKVKFIFEVNGIREETEITYLKEQSRRHIENDIKEWFFSNYYMWFSFEKDGVKINLED